MLDYTTPPASVSPSPPASPSSTTTHFNWSPSHHPPPPPISSSAPHSPKGHVRIPSGVISSLIDSLAAISAPPESHNQDISDHEEDWHASDIMLSAQRPLPARTTSSHLGGFEWFTGEDSDATGHTSRDTHSVTRSPGSVRSLQSQDTTLSLGQANSRQAQHDFETTLASSGAVRMDKNTKARSSRDALAEQMNGTSSNTAKGGLTVFSAASKFLRPSRSRQSLKEGGNSSREATPSPKLGLLKVQPSHHTRGSPSSPDSTKSGASLNLSGHLIPSRRSSLRHSRSDSSQPDHSKNMSISSHDLKSLNIDQDLIEEDDSTVRRIRELQDAKDKRQKEWHREAKNSDNLKRKSAPSPKSLNKSTPHRTPTSVVGIVMELPDKENGVEGSSTAPVTKAVEEKIPNSHQTPSSNVVHSRGPSLFHQHRDSFQSTERMPDLHGGEMLKHRGRISTQLKRSLTTNSILLDTSGNIQAAVDEEVDTFLNSSRFTQKVIHPRTGRIIAFSEVGDREGFPVICCVGMGLTRYLTAFYDELAKSLKLRLITPDRPGIGGTDACAEGQGTPLNWADDVYVLCNVLEITKFSLLAHSAGAIYALATALRLPQYVRGQIRLLAPWIPPSQLSTMSKWGEAPPTSDIPFSQKLLAVLPPSFLKVANARFMSATSASISPKARAKRRSGVIGLEEARRSAVGQEAEARNQMQPLPISGVTGAGPQNPGGNNVSCYQAQTTTLVDAGVIPSPPSSQAPQSSAPGSTRLGSSAANVNSISAATYAALYEASLTHKIWALATQNTNPAVDLLVCLERSRPIGFRYTDVTRSVVILHGSEDTRVNVDNVRWLGKVMKRCEVSILEGEGHGLMANASVMGDVLGEVGKEWEEWARVAQNNTSKEKVDAPQDRNSVSRHNGRMEKDRERAGSSKYGSRSVTGRVI